MEVLAQSDIKNHHKDKAKHKGDCAKVGVFAFCHFRNQLFYYDKEHCSCGKA